MPDPQALCRSCGLCCDGELFRTVPLRPEEIERVERLSLHVITKPGGAQALQQPCAAFAAEGCRVYSDRPAACREFRCALLIAHEDGSVGLDDALSIVRDARSRVGRVRLERSRLQSVLSLHFVRSQR